MLKYYTQKVKPSLPSDGKLGSLYHVVLECGRELRGARQSEHQGRKEGASSSIESIVPVILCPLAIRR